MSDPSETGILSTGDVLNNTYVIAELVASGGTGEVYRATNRVSGREIAVKILKAEFAQDEQFINLMKREASVLHEVIDPSVVRYYDLLESDSHGGFLFIVMEFIEGRSLADEMKDKGPLTESTLLEVAERVLCGLQAAHEKNAFHRDLSPDNILLRGGDPKQATLIDFGIAKDVNEGAKTVVGGGFAGKYQYASPEQMEGRSDARSDLYSLGMTLMGAYRGQSPNAGSSLMQIISAKAVKPDISDMSGPLAALVSQLVEPDPADRLQTAAAALAFLRASTGADDDKTVILPAGGPAARAAPASVTPQTTATGTHGGPAAGVENPPPAKSSRMGLYAGSAVAVMLALGAAGWFSGQFSPAPPEPAVTATATDSGTRETTAADSVAPVSVASESAEPAPESDALGQSTPEPEPLPLADPFVLTIERSSPDDPLRLIGNLPSEDAVPAVTTQLEQQLNAFAVMSDVTPARGEPFAGWSERIVKVALLFQSIESWTVSANDMDVILIAKAQNELEKTALLNGARAAIEGTKLALVDRIEVEIPSIQMDDLDFGLQDLASCGPLTLTGGRDGVIRADDTLSVSGKLAIGADRTRVQAFLSQMAPGREVAGDLEVLNPSVCSVLRLMPTETTEALQIDYSYGTKNDPVEGDIFRIGENPVVDIVLPKERTGFLNVVFVDLAEQVFHLLPHQARTENDLQKIGTVDGNSRRIRVAFPVDQASIAQLGFKVVEPVGANILLAVVTDTPLFDQIRPRAESSGAFIEALGGRLEDLPDEGALVNYRFMMTLE
ncbi:serine/threonine-protein kinase [Neptunicoccus sediminis]|uniref:serine/threonine-protein kinase n=1 Tax=Neptunicoccus sediminis TaxID=1892596 RepID=UPI000845C79D|nr:serine/threonine-protein kinase [Neptunicoccus sediminis]